MQHCRQVSWQFHCCFAFRVIFQHHFERISAEIFNLNMFPSSQTRIWQQFPPLWRKTLSQPLDFSATKLNSNPTTLPEGGSSSHTTSTELPKNVFRGGLIFWEILCRKKKKNNNNSNSNSNSNSNNNNNNNKQTQLPAFFFRFPSHKSHSKHCFCSSVLGPAVGVDSFQEIRFVVDVSFFAFRKCRCRFGA